MTGNNQPFLQKFMGSINHINLLLFKAVWAAAERKTQREARFPFLLTGQAFQRSTIKLYFLF